jgi:hypothetical protein
MSLKIPLLATSGASQHYARLISELRMGKSDLLSIPPIRLYPITCLDRYQRRCHNLARNAQLGRLPVHDEARRSCFVTVPPGVSDPRWMKRARVLV